MLERGFTVGMSKHLDGEEEYLGIAKEWGGCGRSVTCGGEVKAEVCMAAEGLIEGGVLWGDSNITE